MPCVIDGAPRILLHASRNLDQLKPDGCLICLMMLRVRRRPTLGPSSSRSRNLAVVEVLLVCMCVCRCMSPRCWMLLDAVLFHLSQCGAELEHQIHGLMLRCGGSNFVCFGDIAHHLAFLLHVVVECPCPHRLSTGSFICAVSVELKRSSRFYTSEVSS